MNDDGIAGLSEGIGVIMIGVFLLGTAPNVELVSVFSQVLHGDFLLLLLIVNFDTRKHDPWIFTSSVLRPHVLIYMQWLDEWTALGTVVAK